MRAIAQGRKLQPFGENVPISYQRRFSIEEFRRLQDGFIPRQMEDKWFVYFDEGKLHLHRSWTGIEIYSVDFEADVAGASVKQALCDKEQVEKSGAAYQAALLDFLVSNLLLGEKRPFPVPASLPEGAAPLFQHNAFSTGLPTKEIE